MLNLEGYVTAQREAIHLFCQEKIPELETEKKQLQTKLNNVSSHRTFIRCKRRLKKRIESIDSMIQYYQNGTCIKNYETQILPFLKAYMNLRDNNLVEENRQNSLPGIKSCRSLSNFAPQSSSGRQGIITEEYCAMIEKKGARFENVQQDTCIQCKGQVLSCPLTSSVKCVSCGFECFVLDAISSNMSYTTDVDFTSFSYKRTNHFEQWLQCLQGKETVEIPDEKWKQIMEEFFQRRILNASLITAKLVREVLKHLKFDKLYKHANYISYRLSGIPPQRLPPKEEEKCRLMFLAAQEPFKRHKGPIRKNFLSYSYCLYKFCELLGCDNILSTFSLLKGRDKLEKQDEIFKKICADLNWEFIPSTTCRGTKRKRS